MSVPRPTLPPSALTRRRFAGLAALAVTASAGLAASLAPSTSAATPPAPGLYVVGTTPVQLSQPSDALLGRVTPAANADTQGMFGPQVGWPLIPVHAALLANGHLLSYGSPLGTAQQGGLAYDDWNPALGTVTGAHVDTPSMGYDSFCNSIQILPDGRALMVGGNSDGKTSMSTMVYDPATKNETMGANLNAQRWYATTLRLTDDRMLVLGGANYYDTGAYQNPNDNSGVGVTPEVGTGLGAWTSLTGATSTTAFGAQDNRWWYPRAFNAPDGSVVGVSANQLWKLDPSGTGSVTSLGTIPASLGVSGAAVMYAPGKLLLAGGGQAANYDTVTATNAATTVDLATPTPTVKAVTPMALKRNWLNLTVLPTGQVLANGGTVVGTNGGADNSSYATELWDPTTQTWRTGASAQRIRTYHSTAVLLPSGAVFTGGGGVPGPEVNLNAELYYPPSLFTRDAAGAVAWADRPTITSLAGSLTWGGQVTLGLGAGRTIASVSLISAARVTHSVDTDQRRIPLTFTQNGAAVTASLPTSRSTVPPGTYLLSVVDGKGVPSASQLVTLRNGAAGQVTVYEPDASAGQTGGTGTSLPGVVPLTVGSSVSLEAVNYPGYRLRHLGATMRLDPIAGTATSGERFDSAFVVRSGLSGAGGVSFEAANAPGSFVSVQNGVASLRANDGSAPFAASATFTAQTGLTGQNTSFALTSDPTTFLRHQNFLLTAQKSDGSDLFRQDATFSVRGALGPVAGTATLRNVGSGLLLATARGATAQGTGLVQDTAGSATSTWVLVDAGGGRYKIANPATGQVLGINGMSQANGGTGLIWGDNGTADHLWTFVPRAGHYLLVNVNSGKVLGVDRMSTAAGAAVLQWDDNGTVDHYWDIASGPVMLRNARSGLVLATAGGSAANGVAVVQDAVGSATGRWTLTDGGNGTLKVVNSTGLLLGIAGMSQANGGTALLWGDNGTADHLWRLAPRDGHYLLVNVNSRKVLGVDGMSTAAGAAVLQWDDNGTADHLWDIVP